MLGAFVAFPYSHICAEQLLEDEMPVAACFFWIYSVHFPCASGAAELVFSSSQAKVPFEFETLGTGQNEACRGPVADLFACIK